MIAYAWIIKLLRDVAFTRRPRQLSSWFKKWLISWNLAIWTVHVLEKVLFQCFWVPRGQIHAFVAKPSDIEMFLLDSGSHVGGHLDVHQHGVSIQVSRNLGKKILNISCLRGTAVIWILARVLFQILDFVYWTVLIFILNGVTLKTSKFWAIWCIFQAPLWESLWSGHNWKGLFLRQKWVSIDDANFGQRWWRRKWNEKLVKVLHGRLRAARKSIC